MIQKLFIIFAIIGWGGYLGAKEYPIGKPFIKNGMEISAVYLQPVQMDLAHSMLSPEKADIHLEADIHAFADNPNGFAEGDWIPLLKIFYLLTKEKSHYRSEGTLMMMVANDGPHYGSNIKLAGPGRYHLIYRIDPPTALARHIDKETGVKPWFAPFQVEWSFVYAGIGKKGAY